MKIKNLLFVIFIMISIQATAQPQIGAGLGHTYSLAGITAGYKLNSFTANFSIGYYPLAGLRNSAISGKVNVTEQLHVGAMFGGVTVVEITEQTTGDVESKIVTGSGFFAGVDLPLFPKWTLDLGAGFGVPNYERSLKGTTSDYSNLAKTSLLINLGIYYSF